MFERVTMARYLPFAAYMLFIPIQQGLESMGLSKLDLRWLYLLQISVVLSLILYFRRDYIELRVKLPFSQVVLALAVGIFVFVLWINLNAPWMMIKSKTDPLNWLQAGTTLDWALIGVRWCGAALVVPVMEELFWRSFIMRWIDNPEFLQAKPAATSLKAFLITAALFASEHSLLLAGFVAGLAYNFLYRRSENLWSPILSHAVTNGVLGLWVLQTAKWSYW